MGVKLPGGWTRWMIVVGIVAFLPLPILISDFIEEATGETEISYLKNLKTNGPDILRRLNDTVADQKAEALAHFRSRPVDDLGQDPKAAWYMSHEFVRETLGRSKIIRFVPVEQAQVTPDGDGFRVLGSFTAWSGREYTPVSYETLLTYKGGRQWHLKWMTTKVRKGKVRSGYELAMPE